ncbi:hypothetical protein SRHO_G00127240 [Serrasalmus rhombeus]
MVTSQEFSLWEVKEETPNPKVRIRAAAPKHFMNERGRNISTFSPARRPEALSVSRADEREGRASHLRDSEDFKLKLPLSE